LVISEISDAAPTALLAVKLLAQYLSGKVGKVSAAARAQERARQPAGGAHSLTSGPAPACVPLPPPPWQDTVLSTAQDWLADPACNRNATVLLICGMIYASEENYVEALKCCHTGTTLEM
jgi:coatomer protein complex subunit epsilon